MISRGGPAKERVRKVQNHFCPQSEQLLLLLTYLRLRIISIHPLSRVMILLVLGFDTVYLQFTEQSLDACRPWSQLYSARYPFLSLSISGLQCTARLDCPSM